MSRRSFVFWMVILTITFEIRPDLSAGVAGGLVRSEALSQNVTARITLHSSFGAKHTLEETFREALQEGRRALGLLGASSPLLSRINKNAGKQKMNPASPEFLNLLKACMQIYDWTDGLFDIVRDKKGEKRDHELRVDFSKSTIALADADSFLDFSPVAQGFAIDRMAGVLKAKGYENFLVQVGGGYRASGRDAMNFWRLKIPDNSGRGTLCRVSLNSSSLSIAYRRGGSTSDLDSVLVVTKNATNAMALSSTAIRVGKSQARSLFSKIVNKGFGAVLKDASGKVTTVGDITAACFEE